MREHDDQDRGEADLSAGTEFNMKHFKTHKSAHTHVRTHTHTHIQQREHALRFPANRLTHTQDTTVALLWI